MSSLCDPPILMVKKSDENEKICAEKIKTQSAAAGHGTCEQQHHWSHRATKVVFFFCSSVIIEA